MREARPFPVVIGEAELFLAHFMLEGKPESDGVNNIEAD